MPSFTGSLFVCSSFVAGDVRCQALASLLLLATVLPGQSSVIKTCFFQGSGCSESSTTAKPNDSEPSDAVLSACNTRAKLHEGVPGWINACDDAQCYEYPTTTPIDCAQSFSGPTCVDADGYSYQILCQVTLSCRCQRDCPCQPLAVYDSNDSQFAFIGVARLIGFTPTTGSDNHNSDGR